MRSFSKVPAKVGHLIKRKKLINQLNVCILDIRYEEKIKMVFILNYSVLSIPVAKLDI